MSRDFFGNDWKKSKLYVLFGRFYIQKFKLNGFVIEFDGLKKKFTSNTIVDVYKRWRLPMWSVN